MITKTTNPEARKVKEYGAFDVLRFLLASVVALSHIGIFTWNQAGNLAVQVFFALSGWLIGTILYRTKASDLCRFYFNRSTRIWVPYFVCVAAIYLVSLIHDPVRSSRWFEFLGYDLTFTHNWFTLTPDLVTAISQMPLKGTGNHLWSLAVEEQFYLVAPLIITIIPFGRSIIVWAVIGAFACGFGTQYGAISVAVCAVMVSSYAPEWHRTAAARAGLAVVAIGIAIAMAFGLANYFVIAPLFSVAVVLLCAQPLRRSAVVRWLGGVSFPFYLWAWVGTFAFHALLKHIGVVETTPLKVCEFFFTVAAGAAAYHLIDVQVMSRRDGVYRRKIGWALGATGYVLILSGILLWLDVRH